MIQHYTIIVQRKLIWDKKSAQSEEDSAKNKKPNRKKKNTTEYFKHNSDNNQPILMIQSFPESWIHWLQNILKYIFQENQQIWRYLPKTMWN